MFRSMGLRSWQFRPSWDYVYVQQYPSLSAKVPQQRRGRQTRALDRRPQQRHVLLLGHRSLVLGGNYAFGRFASLDPLMCPGKPLRNTAAKPWPWKIACKHGSPSRSCCLYVAVSYGRYLHVSSDWPNHVFSCNVPALDVLCDRYTSRHHLDY
jgi:hypothetical protein